MDRSPTELEAYVRQRAPEIAKSIRQAAQAAHNEADSVAGSREGAGAFREELRRETAPSSRTDTDQRSGGCRVQSFCHRV